MISMELIRRYPFFAGLSWENLSILANAGQVMTFDAGHYFFLEQDHMNSFYVNVEGAVAIVFQVPDINVEHSIADQLTGEMQTRDVVVTTIGPGRVFGWSGLVPPHLATATAKALTPCRVIVFDCHHLRAAFEENCEFGYRMMTKAAQVIRQRLRDQRIESLAPLAE